MKQIDQDDYQRAKELVKIGIVATIACVLTGVVTCGAKLASKLVGRKS